MSTGADILIRALEHEGVDVMFGVPGAPSSPPTTRSWPALSATSSPATSRAPGTWPRDTPGQPAGSACASPPRGPVPPTSSPRWPTPSSTRCRWWRSPGRSPPTPWATTPSRRRTPPGSPCRPPSTTTSSPRSRRSPTSSTRRSTSPPRDGPGRCWSTCPRTSSTAPQRGASRPRSTSPATSRRAKATPSGSRRRSS